MESKSVVVNIPRSLNSPTDFVWSHPSIRCWFKIFLIDRRNNERNAKYYLHFYEICNNTRSVFLSLSTLHPARRHLMIMVVTVPAACLDYKLFHKHIFTHQPTVCWSRQEKHSCVAHGLSPTSVLLRTYLDEMYSKLRA